MTKLILKNIRKEYKNGTLALDNVNLTIEDKEFIVIVGPSGSGKSTLIRCIAGLEKIDQGNLYIDDKLVNKLEPRERDVAMVFQSYALYPHLNVYDNIAFGLELKKVKKKEIERLVNQVAEKLEITEYLDRLPKELSGGQRQRVALGRAIVRSPKVFLLDEPLSNLDAKLRVSMRYEIAKLQKELATTMVYVTHDQIEAMTMGDRLVVMDQGKILQVGSPEEIYERPACKFVAEFIGSPKINLIQLDLTRDDRIFDLPVDIIDEKRSVIAGIRPENLTFVNGEDYTITLVENLGSEKYFYLEDNSSNTLIIKGVNESKKAGDKVSLSIINKEKVNFFDTETENLLARKINI